VKVQRETIKSIFDTAVLAAFSFPVNSLFCTLEVEFEHLSTGIILSWLFGVCHMVIENYL
jgi:hypothetical protein